MGVSKEFRKWLILLKATVVIRSPIKGRCVDLHEIEFNLVSRFFKKKKVGTFANKERTFYLRD